MNDDDKKNQLIGGNKDFTIPMYQQQNDPSLKTGEDESKPPEYVKKEYMGEKKHGGIEPLLNLQLYPQKAPPKPNVLQQKMDQMPHPIATMTPYVPPQFATHMQEVMKGYQQPFIYKDYHINIGGITNDHEMVNKIYNDMLPIQNVLIAYKSLAERNYLASHIRSTFLSSEEGELIALTTKSGTSGIRAPESKIECLTSRLKLLEQSPYSNNLFSKNPYDNMKNGLIVFRSCYPIEYDSKTRSAICAKNSTGINVKIYALSDEDYKVIQGTEDIDKIKCSSTVWKEIMYYKFIRDEICKNLVCPNFIQSYCYFSNEDAVLNFEKPNSLAKIINPFSKYSIVLLTESPNDSLYGWGCIKYKKNKDNPSNVLDMVGTGTKNLKRWMVILFQMMATFYVMYDRKFIFTNIDVSQNYFIKNINSNSLASQYWIYNIDGIEYFIPNYGDLLLFDTKFCDKMNGNHLTAKFIDDSSFKDDEFKKIFITTINNVFNLSNFTSIFKKMGGADIPEEVKSVLTNITTKIKEHSTNVKITNFVEDVIMDVFNTFLHSRIGTDLLENESSSILGTSYLFKKGDLVLKKDIFGPSKSKYKILLYKTNEDAEKCNCIADINIKYSCSDILKNDLYKISSNTVILQKFSSSNDYISSTDNIIETYYLKS